MPHFVRHYERFGITEFHVAVPRRLTEYISSVATGYRVFQYHDFDVAETVTGGVSAVSSMRELVQEPSEWVVIVDLDEFVEFGKPVSEIVIELEAENATAACGILYDRFPVTGKPQPFDDGSDLASLYPIRARFIKNVMGGTDVKVVLIKGHLRGQAGAAHHFFEDAKVYSRQFEISHYKWNDPSLTRIRQAYEMSREAGRDWSIEYKRILDHYAKHERFSWETFGGEVRRSSCAADDARSAIRRLFQRL